jgi:hypothetical protein
MHIASKIILVWTHLKMLMKSLDLPKFGIASTGATNMIVRNWYAVDQTSMCAMETGCSVKIFSWYTVAKLMGMEATKEINNKQRTMNIGSQSKHVVTHLET